MSQDIRDLHPTHLVALGEPTHQEPAFGHVRNELFAQLADHGFRSIALETDRVAALTANDYVQGGPGTLDDAMTRGFTHNFGALEPNRALIAWMRDYNSTRPLAQRLTFHGFDAPTENTTAPSPRTYLEHARDYLGLDLDLASIAGPDDRWDRTEAILNASLSPGDTPSADKLRALADDMLVCMYRRAPELIAATSRARWHRAKTHLTAGLDLLRYHKQSSQEGPRLLNLLATRDALMAQNLLDIRRLEAPRGGTLVFAHNLHLRRDQSTFRIDDTDHTWSCAGAILTTLTDEPYTFIPGSLGHSDALGLPEPAPTTYEGHLQHHATTWTLTTTTPTGTPRTNAPHGYFPLDQPLVADADAILHITGNAPAA
ncbi:erythromycin esterase family protein [Actinokineospora terrae]|uniref:Erythromycin esterase n=1 Tax=Actinokineospora terrae TaxID=155974 RepID=A0A1H9XIR6_9PSEU|nr:erythromycin esterase family protein [Actinokineospora terrae]SES45553.1 Erythromycin esterase [Actinokineospora terrae]